MLRRRFLQSINSCHLLGQWVATGDVFPSGRTRPHRSLSGVKGHMADLDGSSEESLHIEEALKFDKPDLLFSQWLVLVETHFRLAKYRSDGCRKCSLRHTIRHIPTPPPHIAGSINCRPSCSFIDLLPSLN